MNEAQLQLIKEEVERIERETGHGQVLIKIQDGKIHLLQSAISIMLNKNGISLDRILK